MAGCVLVALPSVAFAQSSYDASGYPQGSGQGYDSSGGGLQAGGLTPPEEAQRDPYTADSTTEQELAKADQEDSGRGLEFFWLNGEAGYEWVGLQTFHANNLVDAKVVKSSEGGFLYGAGAGVRLLFLTLGARFRNGAFSQWNIWTLDGELGLHLPLGSVEPYFTLGGGYATIGSFAADKIGTTASSNSLDITGWNVRAGVGVDVYLTPVVSIGGNLTGDLLMLARPKVAAAVASGGGTGSVNASNAQATADEIYAADGSSIGGGLTGTAVLGLHF